MKKEKEKNKNFVYFTKLNPNAIIPSKRNCDGGFDLYARFDEDEVKIEPFQSKLIGTGLSTAFSNNYVIVIKERGSTGIKNIKINAGVIDAGFRGEIFVCLYNANSKPLYITKHIDENKKDVIQYPYQKAIAQMLVLPLAPVEFRGVTNGELSRMKSERNNGKLGNSGK